MTTTKPWLHLARPYGGSFQAPSTAQYITEKGTLSLGEETSSHSLSTAQTAPIYIDLIVKLVPLPALNNPLLSFESHNAPLYSKGLENYHYRGIQLQVTPGARIEGQYVSLDPDNLRFSSNYQSVEENPHQDPSLSEKKMPILYEFCYDNIHQDVLLSTDSESGLLALGGPFAPGRDLSYYAQYFVRFYEDHQNVLHDLTPLHQWWDKGIFLPLSQPPSELAISNAHRQRPYLSLLDALREGEATFCMMRGSDENGDPLLSTYQSIDAQRHGLTHALITFKEIKNVL